MDVRSFDTLSRDQFSPLWVSPLLIADAGDCTAAYPPDAAVILVDRAGNLPMVSAADVSAMVTTRPGAPSPWVSVSSDHLDAALARVNAAAARTPVATAIFARILKAGEELSFEAALDLESLAYSTLLGGEEFAAWLGCTDRELPAEVTADPVRYDRDSNHVTLTLATPGNRNAMTASMRDALFEMLANVIDDPSNPSLELRGQGRCFSTGGHLPEFGTARDLARAHIIRTQRSCALLLHRLGERAEVRLHGACIGSGIEIPAAAARRVATRDCFVQLPELKMGLIPGAGGTVTLARAIGRHRLFWLVFGSFRLGAEQGRDWGLFHEIRA